MSKDHSPGRTRAGTEAQSPSRRRMLAGGAASLLAATGTEVRAQDGNFWSSIFGGTANGSQRPPSTVRPSEIDHLNDLRPDNIPWRSDTMIEQIDQAIARHERLVAQRGGWGTIPTGRTIRPDDDDERMPAIRRRLSISGDMPQEASFRETSFTLDGYVEAGIKRFQERHGLRVNGRADRPTVEAMNVPAQTRIEQLRLNRRRLQELGLGRTEERYILVNTAAYQLEAVESHEVVSRHRVIVGKPDRQTPSIRAVVRAMNFFPYWRVPQSVATLDLIPRLRKEPEYLRNEGIRVFNGVNGPELDPAAIDWNTADGSRLWFRQDPGERNALGLVRIDMPNPDIVYMHDTPLKPLFGQRQRAFSAGCVRVQDVFKLVEWIARHEVGWERGGRAQEVIGAGQPLDLTLTRPVPVYFTYITAWAERDGRVHFQPDIYGRDGIKDGSGQHDPDAPPPPSGIAAVAP